MEVRFSPKGTGACPHCVNKSKCKILSEATKGLADGVEARNDDVMEIVIYRCPEFEDLNHQEDTAPFA